MEKHQIMMEVLLLDIEIKEVKQRFYNFITDKSIDLDERWDVFCKLPSYLSESYTYVQEILFTSDNEVIEIYQLMDFDTRANVEVCEIINDFTDDLLKIKVDIKLTKENILKANIKSFINDH